MRKHWQAGSRKRTLASVFQCALPEDLLVLMVPVAFLLLLFGCPPSTSAANYTSAKDVSHLKMSVTLLYNRQQFILLCVPREQSGDREVSSQIHDVSETATIERYVSFC